MIEELVKFETAKIAAEKGFNVNTAYAYNSKYRQLESAFDFTGNNTFSVEDVKNAEDNLYISYLAPSQSVLQKYIREVHKIHITTFWTGKGFDFQIKFTPEKIENERVYLYITHEEALEQGLVFALNLIDK